MKTILYTGGTGCGKTYRAITESASFFIAVPCRQLAYEIYWDYLQTSRIDTGEVHMGDLRGNRVCVYENLPREVIAQDTLIVDEAHHLNDPERGGALFEKILLNKAADKRIVLLTATDTLSDEVREILEVDEIELAYFGEEPRKVELEFHDFCVKVRDGMTAIVFVKYTPDDDVASRYARFFDIDEARIGVISAKTPSYERFKTQLRFKFGELQVVIATNVLAQGLNFPAQGVLIEYNKYDDWGTVAQKLGRIVRPLFGISVGYYCLHRMPEKRKSRGVPTVVERTAQWYMRPSGDEINISTWGFMQHEVPSGFWNYGEYKYSHRFLRTLAADAGPLEMEEAQALAFLDEQSRLLENLLQQRGSTEIFN